MWSSGGLVQTWEWICGFYKSREFLELLSNYQLFKDDPAQWLVCWLVG